MAVDGGVGDKDAVGFVDLKTEYFDLGLENREATGDRVTVDAARATKRLGVGVKCATITPNAARVAQTAKPLPTMRETRI